MGKSTRRTWRSFICKRCGCKFRVFRGDWVDTYCDGCSTVIAYRWVAARARQGR